MVMAKSTASKLPASSARSPKAARQRRLQAARLFEQGLSQAEVARRLQVSRQTASRWHARWRTGGRAGLAGPGRWAAPPASQTVTGSKWSTPCWPARSRTGSTPT
jgi:hypothetical protein